MVNHHTDQNTSSYKESVKTCPDTTKAFKTTIINLIPIVPSYNYAIINWRVFSTRQKGRYPNRQLDLVTRRETLLRHLHPHVITPASAQPSPTQHR